nr:RDD family protein [Terriglobus roseus]
MPTSTLSEDEARALKQQVANRLAEHRQRRPRPHESQPSLPLENAPTSRYRVADQVAARFAQSLSYRDFLQQEAEQAIRQAEAAAEVARRSAEAITAVQQELLDEIHHWDTEAGAPPAGPAEVITFAPTTEESSVPLRSEAAVELRSEATVVLRSEAIASEPQDLSPTISTPAVTTPAIFGSITGSFADSLPAATIRTSYVASIGDGTAEEYIVEPVEPAVALPANLIEFPRQLVAARRARPRLAEGPLRDEADNSPERAQLRIFEVEASSVSIEPMTDSVLPEWHTIRLEAQLQTRTTDDADSGISFGIPLHVAPISQRIMAATVDGCCIATGFLAAVAVAAYASPSLPTGIPAAIAAAGSLFAFALMYLTLFFSLSGITPGMRYARIAFCTFNDENPSRSAMRRRIFALLLAGAPVGLGLVWACMDEDKLGWHDRISRMYPRAY